MKVLQPAFYLQDTVTVARQLLGKMIIRRINQHKLTAMIVETEAYRQDDEASHSFRGKTGRSAPMFESGGLSYVYFIYGMYDCCNVVTEAQGYGGAVLIRAVHPLSGKKTMWQNRFPDKPYSEKYLYNLTNGPGKLCQALGISTKKDNHKSLNKGDLIITEYRDIPDNQIRNSLRIGISKATDKEWRFFIKDDPYVSGAKVLSQ